MELMVEGGLHQTILMQFDLKIKMEAG